MNLPYDSFVGWLILAAVCGYFLRGIKKMIDIKALQAEVAKETNKDKFEKAKKQLVAAERDIQNAEQILANLKRKRDDLLVSIAEGSN